MNKITKKTQPILPGFTLMAAKETLQKISNIKDIDSCLKNLTQYPELLEEFVWQICQTNFSLINGTTLDQEYIVTHEQGVSFAFLPASTTGLYTNVLVVQLECKVMETSHQIEKVFVDAPEHFSFLKSCQYNYITAFLLENKQSITPTTPTDIAQRIMSYCLKTIKGDQRASYKQIHANSKGGYAHSLAYSTKGENKSEAALKLFCIATKMWMVTQSCPLVKAHTKIRDQLDMRGLRSFSNAVLMVINMRNFVMLKSAVVSEFEKEFMKFWRTITFLEELARNDPQVIASSFSFSSFKGSVNQEYKYGQVLLNGYDLVKEDGESNPSAFLIKRDRLLERLNALENRLSDGKRNQPKYNDKIIVNEGKVFYNTTNFGANSAFIPLSQSSFKLEIIGKEDMEKQIGIMPDVEFRYANMFKELGISEDVYGMFIDTSVVSNKTLTVVSTIAKNNAVDSGYRYITFLYVTSPRRKEKTGVDVYATSQRVYSAIIWQVKKMFPNIRVVIADFDPSIRSATRENNLNFWGCYAHFKRIVAARASRKTLKGVGASQEVVAFVKSLPFSLRQNDLIKDWVSKNQMNYIDKIFLDKIKSHYFNGKNLYFEFSSFENIDKTVAPFYLTNNVSERVFSFLKKKKYPSCLEGILYHINYQLTTPNLIGVKNGIKNPSKLAYVLKRA